jgi:hypothetical protein
MKPMEIQLKSVTIRDVAQSYQDNGQGGVVGLDGKLNVRPAFQREFVYKDDQRAAVMNTIRKGFPLNVMYWAVNDDGTYEVLDGQQRTISFCQYVDGAYSIDIDGHPKGFQNLTPTQKQQILDYPLMVYVCRGTQEQKLDWFETINIAGLKLTPQELRNAAYVGPWLSHAKSIFSKPTGAANQLASKHHNTDVLRQGLLELALKWISEGKIAHYMAGHQHDPNANELWTYFRNVIEWAKATFPVWRKEMRSVQWGPLYDKYGNTLYDTDTLEAEVKKLMVDDDVTKKRGIYPYVLDGDVRHLSIRAFTDQQKRKAYEEQSGRCGNGTNCLTPGNSNGKMTFQLTDMHADHKVPWTKGGKTEQTNCRMLCIPCNLNKGAA